MSFVWRKRLFLLLFPLLLALTVWQARIESDLNAFFTATTEQDSKLLSQLLQSGELSRRYLLVVDAQNNSNLTPFAANLVQQLAKLEQVEQVWATNEPPRAWLDALSSYAPYHARMFSLNPEQETLFNAQALEKRAAFLKSALLSPQASFIKTIAKQDPLLLSLQGFKTMQSQFAQSSALNKNSVAIILQSKPAALDSAAHQQLQDAIRQCFNQLNQGQSFQLNMSGVPVVSVATYTEINRDVTLVSTVSSLAVVLVFLLLFRSFAALHWVMMIQTASFVVGALAVLAVFGHIHSLTLALGASLVGICVDYPIHIMVHGAKHKTPLQDVVRLLWASLFMGGLTTVIGYVALGFTGFPGFEQIAVFALFSIAASLALTRWLLPALLEHSVLHIAHLPLIGAWVEFCGRWRKVLLPLFVLGTIIALLLMPELRWMNDMQKLAMNMDVIKQQDKAVRSHFANIEPSRFVLIQANDLETALQRSEAAERCLQTLKQQNVLNDYQGLFPWLVSEQLQQKNLETYQQANIQPTWQAALQKQGLSVEKLGVLSNSASVLTKQALPPVVSSILSGRLIESPQGITISIWLGQHDPDKLIAGLQGLDGVRYFSQKDQLDHLAKQYRDSSLKMLAVGIVIMAVFIWLQQRRLKNVLLTLVPSLAAVLFIFAGWAVMGEEISFLHVIGLLLAVSLCVDYGIFFIENRAGDTDVTYHAIASSTLTTLASFGALGLGKTPTLPILAVSVSLGVTVGFLLCPLLISKKT